MCGNKITEKCQTFCWKMSLQPSLEFLIMFTNTKIEKAKPDVIKFLFHLLFTIKKIKVFFVLLKSTMCFR